MPVRTVEAEVPREVATDVSWRWRQGPTCEEQYCECVYGIDYIPINGAYCWDVEVTAPDGCPSALYAELTALDRDERVIEVVPAAHGPLAPGGRTRLTFTVYGQEASILQGRLTALECY